MQFRISFFASPLIVASLAALSCADDKSAESQKPTATKITLYPSAEAKPALKYQLLPPLDERRSGNAAVIWNRVFAQYDTVATYIDDNSFIIRLCDWLDVPLGDPQEEVVRKEKIGKDLNLLRDSAGYFEIMDRAARCESCDWTLPVHEGNFQNNDLSDIEVTRKPARFLLGKIRLEIIEGRYEQAVKTMQSCYSLARQVSQGPTLMNGLIGSGITRRTNDLIYAFVQHPDSPNLYWALSALPHPYVDFRPGFEADSLMLYLDVPELRHSENKKLFPEQWQLILSRTVDFVAEAKRIVLLENNVKLDKKKFIAETIAASKKSVPQAKQRLIKSGRNSEEVEKMCEAQVILLDAIARYDELSQNEFKWAFLPYPEAVQGARQAEEAIRNSDDALPLAKTLLGSVVEIKTTEANTEWNFAVLRIFEALRLYAAAHDGRWPDKLEDVTEVPIPKNPFDGKSFMYKRDGDQAILDCELGPQKPSMQPSRFEITLKQKPKS